VLADLVVRELVPQRLEDHRALAPAEQVVRAKPQLDLGALLASPGGPSRIGLTSRGKH
jgi:hypothetical protein